MTSMLIIRPRTNIVIILEASKPLLCTVGTDREIQHICASYCGLVREIKHCLARHTMCGRMAEEKRSLLLNSCGHRGRVVGGGGWE